VKYNFWIPRVR